MSMASILGANIYTDIFFIAFKIPNLFRTIFAEGAFSQTFIPGFSASSHKSLFAVATFSRIMLLVILMTCFVFLFQGAFAYLFGLGYDETTREMAKPLIAINFLYLDCIFIVTFLAAMLQYRKHFATTAFSTALLNISMIIALIIAKDFEKSTIVYYLSWSVVAGGLLQAFTHYLAARHFGVWRMLRVGFLAPKERFIKVKDDVKRFNRSFIPSVLGSSTSQISAFIDTLLGTFLSAGSISYLYYANRILQLPLALFAIATATALFPMVAKAINNNRHDEALILLKKSFWVLAFLLATSALGGIILAEPIMKLLFERGAFNHQDTVHSAIVLQMYMIGLIPFGLAKIFNLWLYSRHEQMKAAKISAIALGCNALFSLALFYPLGASGLALAGSLTGVILFILTIRLFGVETFWSIIYDKKLIALITILCIEALLLVMIRPWLS